MTQEAWCTSSNLGSSWSLHASELAKSGIAEYDTSYDNTVELSEEIIFTHPLYLICYDETRFEITQKVTITKKNVKRTLTISEGDTREVLSSWY